MAQVTTSVSHPKHDIHKFRDIKPKLGRDNWVSWKRELLATARDHGLYAITTNPDLLPLATDLSVTTTNNVTYIGTTPLTQLVDEWNDRDNTAYNQVMLCISPELQTAIDDTNDVSAAWKILVNKFESTDPSKISIVRTKYENYHMVDGQSVVTYLTTMKEFRSQLSKMGEVIADSTHAATILRNVPESWRAISQTIRMITRDPEIIEERLEAHEADLNALEMSNQAATAFIAHSKPNRPTNNMNHQTQTQNHSPGRFDPHMRGNAPRISQRPVFYQCNNCGRSGHSAS
jgi:gag-polypeptide of LTR copia-type